MSESVINDVRFDGDLVSENITDRYCRIEDITNGIYYFVIVAYNEAGETVSNSISMVVWRAPISFKLTSDAGIPVDNDGSFELIWTHSEYALNYTVFISDYHISILNESVQEIYNFIPTFEWPTYRYNLCHCSGTGLNNGTYFFLVIASNEYGKSSSECLVVEVGIPMEKPRSNNDLFPFLPQIITYIALGSLIAGMIALYKKRS